MDEWTRLTFLIANFMASTLCIPKALMPDFLHCLFTYRKRNGWNRKCNRLSVFEKSFWVYISCV